MRNNEVVYDSDYWYTNRHQLAQEMVFRTADDSLVKLDRSVPGDGTKWYVATWHRGWAYEDNTIEPGELCGAPVADPADTIGLGSSAPGL
jgi:hypothetical protein